MAWCIGRPSPIQTHNNSQTMSATWTAPFDTCDVYVDSEIRTCVWSSFIGSCDGITQGLPNEAASADRALVDAGAPVAECRR